MEQETKRIILVSIWWTAALLLVAGLGWAWYTYIYQFPAYKNDTYHFAMKYPKAWVKTENFKGAAVSFVRPKLSALELFQPNVNIAVQDVPNEIATLSSFSQKIYQQMTAVFGKNITVLEDKDFTFGERLGHRLIIDAPKPDHMKMMFVWTIKGSMAYIFTFMAKEDQFKELSPRVDQMVSSFKFNY